MMQTNDAQPADDNDESTDQQDGGPGSHNEDNSGGAHNDVASGGTSSGKNNDDIEHDVHGDPDTVS